MATLANSQIAPVSSSFINAVTGKGVRRSGKRQEGGFLPLLFAPCFVGEYLWERRTKRRKRI